MSPRGAATLMEFLTDAGLWQEAREWGGTVFLDGEDVSDRCQAVLFHGERATAVRLLVRRPDGTFAMDPTRTNLVLEVRTGEIHTTLRPRPEGWDWPDGDWSTLGDD